MIKKLLVASLLMSGLASANGKTVISGNYDGKFVVIMDYMVRDPSKMIQVPVVDGKFRYEMPSDTLKVYTIQSDKNLGSYRMNFFFSEPVELTVCFTPDIDVATGRDMGYVAEVVSPEGSMSRRITDLKKRITDRIENEPCYKVRDSLETAGKYYSPELMALMKRVNANPELMNDSLEAVINKYYDTDTWRTPEAKAAEERLEQWYRQGGPQKIESGFIVEDNSLAGLFLLAMNSIHAEDTYPYAEIYEKHFKGKFPGHPYDEYMQFIASTYSPEVGKPLIDFEAPDFEGTIYRLSELVEGKPAYLDLWSSQCASCRRTSKAMKAVYDKYSPKGFTVVGVAREFVTDELGRAAIEKDGYKWLNLLELDDANRIYDRYRCSMALGRTVLIDDKGIIVAIDPTVEEVSQWLENYYAGK